MQLGADGAKGKPLARPGCRGHYGDHDFDVQVPAYDGRWLSVARTHFEQGFMALNRAVFQPGRVKLPEDAPSDQAELLK